MREPLSNIGFPCKDHEPRAGKFSGTDPRIFIGRLIKLGFPFSNNNGSQSKEHMWVKVLNLGDNTQLEGVLDNDPIRVTDYDYGSGVGFDVEEIEDVVPPL